MSKKLLSWNVNGLRACMRKGFASFFQEAGADVFCLQEIKLSEGQLSWEPEGYYAYWNYAERRGYSGTALFAKEKPVSVAFGMGPEEPDTEGRIITAEFEPYYVVTVYTPNSKRELTRLDYRMRWEDAFRGYLGGLRRRKPVVVCGDLNVAHQEIDLKNPQSNHKNAGFTDGERKKMTLLLESGFLDTFRCFYPETGDRYSWWSYQFRARERNVGWRIDYFLVSEELRGQLVSAEIHDRIAGSDHCPVELVLD